jgi:hypothetical protein
LFKRASDYLTARAILEEDIPRADSVDPAIPTPVADVIAKALSRTASDRYATAAELAVALTTAMASHGGLASPAEIASVVTSTDELSAQRTRQAKVVADARARTSVSSVDTGVAPTRSLRGEKTSVDRPPRRNAYLAPIAFASLAGAIAIVAIATSPSDERATSEPSKQTPVIVVGKSDLAQIVDAGITAVSPDAQTIEPQPAEVEMPAISGRAPKPGFFSIDSTPFATIFVDGKRIDVTPLLNRSLSAGRHRIRAELADGRSREFSVDVPAGRAAKPITLTW